MIEHRSPTTLTMNASFTGIFWKKKSEKRNPSKLPSIFLFSLSPLLFIPSVCCHGYSFKAFPACLFCSALFAVILLWQSYASLPRTCMGNWAKVAETAMRPPLFSNNKKSGATGKRKEKREGAVNSFETSFWNPQKPEGEMTRFLAGIRGVFHDVTFLDYCLSLFFVHTEIWNVLYK